jgi:hypothetical protein
MERTQRQFFHRKVLDVVGEEGKITISTAAIVASAMLTVIPFLA